MKKNLSIVASIALILALSACVKDEPTVNPQDHVLRIDASSGATNLHQLEEAHFTAIGDAVEEGTQINWFVNGEQVATGKTFTFSSKLPGTFDIAVQSGSHKVSKSYGVRPRFSKGVFLLNEGNYGNETGTLTYINAKHRLVIDSAYFRVNGKRLGNVSQDLAFSDGKIYIISQLGAKNGGEGLLTIAEASTLKHISSYSDDVLAKATPTHIAVVGERIYIRTDKGIYLGSTTGGFTLVAGTEQAMKLRMAVVGERVFALSDGNKLLMIQGNQIVGQVNIPEGSVSGISLSEDGTLWLAYANPNTIAKIDTDPRTFRIQESHVVPQNLSIVGQWGLQTSSSLISSYGELIYFSDLGHNIYVHDFAKNQTNLWVTIENQIGKKSLNKFYNSLSVGADGNVYFAAFDDYATYKDNATLTLSPAKELLIYKEKVNAFPAGFYSIPHKAKAHK